MKQPDGFYGFGEVRKQKKQNSFTKTAHKLKGKRGRYVLNKSEKKHESGFAGEAEDYGVDKKFRYRI